MKQRLDQLKQKFVNASSAQEQDAIMCEIKALISKDAEAVADCALQQIRESNEVADSILRDKLHRILPALSMSYIAKTYFGKSRSWLMQRINGNMVNGKQASFTKEELSRFDAALKDLSANIASISVL